MHVISRKALLDFTQIHPDAEGALDAWYRVVVKARWESIRDVRMVFPHADAVEVRSSHTVTVFNIRGNKYRLLAGIHYNRGKLFVLRILTHQEYDLEQWKETL
jgi:mRNA interferase HigB